MLFSIIGQISPQAPVAESNKSRSRLQKHGGSNMASLRLRKRYDDTTLLALEQARTDVWDVLKGHDPYRDWDKDPALKQVLAEKLMDLADTGVTDRQELRNGTLATLDLKLLHLARPFPGAVQLPALSERGF
jgi:hypothetical protein